MSDTQEFELNVDMNHGTVEGKVKVTVEYPKDKAVLGISALNRIAEPQFTAQLASIYRDDPSVKKAMADAGLSLDGDDEL